MSQLDGSLSSILRLSGSGTHQSPPFNMLSGQIYRATVEQVNAGAVVLRIGEFSLRASTDVKVVPGQTLLLKFNRNSEPPSLEIVRVLPLPTQQPHRHQQVREEKPLNSRIQSLVARQASPLLLFTLLAGLDPERYPPELKANLDAINAHLLSEQQVTNPAGLQNAISKSGLWLEAILRVIQADPSQVAQLQDDLKVALLRLRANQGSGAGGGISQLLDEGLASTLSQVTDGVLARMGLHQVNSVLQAEQGHLHWSVDLPLRLNDQTIILALTIRREHGRDGEEGRELHSWHVELDTELARLGPVRASVFLRQHHLSVALEASNDKAVNLFAQGLVELEQNLREQGFKVETLLSRPLPANEPAAGDSWFENLIEVSV